MDTKEPITPEIANKPTEEKKLEEMVFPLISDPTFVYKKDSQIFWVGIPVSKTDAFMASCIFDSCKLQYLNIFKSVLIEMQKNNEVKNKIIAPGMLNKIRENWLRRNNKV